jgi:hypothetical protein
MKVFVYFNLHKKLFSVKALEGDKKGLVIAHVHVIGLENVTFKVSEAGRQRVLREQKKNVHAGCVGTWAGDINHENLERVTYNPYKYSSFVNMADETPVYTAKKAVLSSKRIYADLG